MLELRGILLGTSGLSVIAVISAWLAATRGVAPPSKRHQVVRLVCIGVLLHACHFSEELLNGFHVRFPALLGASPWPTPFFVSLNVTWMLIWILSLFLIKSHFRVAVFPIWFLAIASAVNGLAHPIMSLVTGGYFPGLWTSPFVGILGVVLLRTLTSATPNIESSHGVN